MCAVPPTETPPVGVAWLLTRNTNVKRPATQFLSVPRSVAAALPTELQELIGYAATPVSAGGVHARECALPAYHPSVRLLLLPWQGNPLNTVENLRSPVVALRDNFDVMRIPDSRTPNSSL